MGEGVDRAKGLGGTHVLIGLGAVPSPNISSSGSAPVEPAPPPPAGVEAKPPVVTPLGPFCGVLPNRSSSRSASALLDLAVDIGVLVVAPPFIAFMLFPFIDVEFEREKLSMRFSSPLMVPRPQNSRRGRKKIEECRDESPVGGLPVARSRRGYARTRGFEQTRRRLA